MEFSKTFKIIWWVILVLLLGTVLGFRFMDIVNGQSVPADVFIFLVFVGLLLLPILSEVEFFGMIKLKRDIEDLKNKIEIKFGDLKNELKLNQSQTLTQNFNSLPTPMTDEALKQFSTQTEKLIKDSFDKLGIKKNRTEKFEVPENNLDLFKVRFNLEKEIRRIWRDRAESQSKLNHKQVPIFRQISDLRTMGFIDGNLFGLIREVLAICNYGIHGEVVTTEQLSFAQMYGQELVDYLKNVK